MTPPHTPEIVVTVVLSFSESKAANDYFKTELNYDVATHQTNFVKDIFNEEETVSRVLDIQTVDQTETASNSASELIHSDEPLSGSHCDKPQGVDVREFLRLFFVELD